MKGTICLTWKQTLLPAQAITLGRLCSYWGLWILICRQGKYSALQKPFKLEIDNLQAWLLSVTREILQTQSSYKTYWANKPTDLIYVSGLVEDKNELFFITEKEFDFCHTFRFWLKRVFAICCSNSYAEFSSSSHGLYRLVLVTIQKKNSIAVPIKK